MKIKTAQMTIAKKQTDFLDITVKSGNKLFSPTWDLVMGIKNQTITKEDYIYKYKSLMRKSFLENKDEWLNILNRESLTLGCYCKQDSFCHRYILLEIFEKICEKYNIEFIYEGEINK